jgi:hypothetical protein
MTRRSWEGVAVTRLACRHDSESDNRRRDPSSGQCYHGLGRCYHALGRCDDGVDAGRCASGLGLGRSEGIVQEGPMVLAVARRRRSKGSTGLERTSIMSTGLGLI